jgi:hypothetical protein
MRVFFGTLMRIQLLNMLIMYSVNSSVVNSFKQQAQAYTGCTILISTPQIFLRATL